LLDNKKIVKPIGILNYKVRIPNPFKKKNLKTLSDEFVEIARNVEVARNRRIEIFDRIAESCENLKNDPINLRERRRLRWYLYVERRFLEAVRKGIKDGLRILEATLEPLKNAKINKEFKNKAFQDVQYVIDAMQFTNGKINVIESRIKIGERLIIR